MSPQSKDILSVLIGLTPVVSSIPVGTGSCLVYFKRLRRRGYRGNIAALYVGGSLIAGIVIASCLVFWLYRGPLAGDGSPLVIDTGYALAGIWGSCFDFCVITFMHVLARALPVPKTRSIRGGRRRGWFYAAGALASMGILLLSWGSFSLIQDSRMSKPDYEEGSPVLLILIAAVYFGLGYWFLRRARASRRIDDAVKSDKRPPVLYLRSFKDETLHFDNMPGSAPYWRRFKRGYLRGKQLLPAVPLYGPMNLELYVTDAVERAMGPFIALGNPDDIFAPVGAARKYLGGPDWRKEFEGMVDKCTAVFVLPGSSRELDWEMGWLLTSGNAAKLFLLFGRWTYGYPVLPAEKLFKFLTPPPEPLVWSRYREGMNALGYTLPVDAPVSSTVMGFDAMGQGRLVSRRCGSPEEYVDAIVSHLAKQVVQQERKRDLIIPIPTSSR